MRHETQEVADEKETGRIEAFSDGLFAFAMTLLVLDLKVPDLPEHHLRGYLAHQIARDWPAFLNFLTSFLTILVMWVNHHRIFTHVRRTDWALLLSNGFLLLGVTVVPFSTAVAARYLYTPDGKLGMALYNVVFIFISICFNVLWRYAAHNDRLFGKNPKREQVDAISERYRFGPLWYVATLAIAWVNPVLSLALCLVLAMFFMMPYEHERPGAGKAG